MWMFTFGESEHLMPFVRCAYHLEGEQYLFWKDHY